MASSWHGVFVYAFVFCWSGIRVDDHYSSQLREPKCYTFEIEKPRFVVHETWDDAAMRWVHNILMSVACRMCCMVLSRWGFERLVRHFRDILWYQDAVSLITRQGNGEAGAKQIKPRSGMARLMQNKSEQGGAWWCTSYQTARRLLLRRVPRPCVLFLPLSFHHVLPSSLSSCMLASRWGTLKMMAWGSLSWFGSAHGCCLHSCPACISYETRCKSPLAMNYRWWQLQWFDEFAVSAEQVINICISYRKWHFLFTYIHHKTQNEQFDYSICSVVCSSAKRSLRVCWVPIAHQVMNAWATVGRSCRNRVG